MRRDTDGSTRTVVSGRVAAQTTAVAISSTEASTAITIRALIAPPGPA